MSVDVMTKEQEGKLVDSVMDAITLTNGGMHPNDAIVKIASDRGYNQNYIRRMVEAFNVSKSLKHHKSASGEARTSSFDIADPSVILAKLYPDDVVSPAAVKQAAWEPAGTDMQETRIFMLDRAPRKDMPVSAGVFTHDGPTFDILMKRACNELYRKERVLEDLRHNMAADRMTLLANIDKLASYFKTVDHEPFARVEGAAMSYFGNGIKPMMDTVWRLARGASFGEKRASCATRPSRLVDKTPYMLVDSIMDARTKYVDSAVKCAAALADVTTYKDRLNVRMRLFSKFSAMAGPAVSGAVAASVNKLLSKLPPTTSTVGDELPGLTYDVLPAAYEAERQGIHTQMMLHDFLRNDPVLSKADPQSVISAYNDIASLAPRAAATPVAMRALLRRAVEMESFDPNELSNIAKFETELGKQEQPMSSLVA